MDNVFMGVILPVLIFTLDMPNTYTMAQPTSRSIRAMSAAMSRGYRVFLRLGADLAAVGEREATSASWIKSSPMY